MIVRRLARGARLLIPPGAAITLAVVVLVSTSVFAFGLHMVAGPGMALAFLLGATAGMPSATATTTTLVRVGAGFLSVVGATSGALSSSSPLGCATLVGGLAIIQAPLTQRAAGIGMFAPVIAAIFATVDVSSAPLLLGAGTAVGLAFVHGLAAVLKLPRAAAPVDPTIARFHAAVLALFAAPGVFITRSLELGHGFWLVLTLAAVLRPTVRGSREAASGRFAGTVIGIGLAVVISVLLPGPILLVLAAASAVLMVAWAASKDVERQAMFGTLVVLLVVSGGHLTNAGGIELWVERLALTAIAAGLAVGAASALERIENILKPHPPEPTP